MAEGRGRARARGGASGRGAATPVGRARALLALKVAAALGALWFAVEGGEYGTSDLYRQRRASRALETEVDSLQRIVDSLARYHRQLGTDVVLQERIAREEFGMVKGPNEIVYRFADPVAPDSAGKGTASP